VAAIEKVIRERAYELGRTVEATNSGSLRERNSNARKGWEKDSCARLFAGVWSRLVMNRPLIGGEEANLVALRWVESGQMGRESSV